MNGIKLTLHVNAAAAVRVGSGIAGPTALVLSASDLAQLTPEQREALACHLERRPGWGEPLTKAAPPIGQADLATLRVLLSIRADAMRLDPSGASVIRNEIPAPWANHLDLRGL